MAELGSERSSKNGILHHSVCSITAGNVCLWTNLLAGRPVRSSIEPLSFSCTYMATFNLEIFRIYGTSIIGHQTKAPHTFLNQKESFVLQRLWPSFHLVFGVR